MKAAHDNSNKLNRSSKRLYRHAYWPKYERHIGSRIVKNGYKGIGGLIMGG